ncbi:hydantoinase/carbamoylase family amidase [Methylobacterium sp. OT2]|uniref:hydantoinase/carbamoylase family amidase n=1 Tax=Methylobacterium sp. OT2 TaxID=2813779 RepID=UPI00197B6AB5|nr:hydantoinase/carbamoylase family amidase [Methylobacterium sp. OT2]MBN4096082.1 hydantoinase/carbamoylase family amidase [Methylobacterium sp. OT2]
MMDRIERLAQISAYPWNLTRRVFSPKQAEAEALVRGWMEEAGLAVQYDPAGNLIGRIEGSVSGGPAVVIGGHIDTREDACRTDGTLGVLIGIAGVERVIQSGVALQYAIEVVAFVEDAAGRFGPHRLGSKAMVGRLDPHVLDWDDAYNVTQRQAMQSHGLEPETITSAKRSAGAILAYLEVAAEAGPVLEQARSPIGVVEALSTSAILRVTLMGQTVSAETVPMAGRRDTLAGTAACILAAERIGSAREDVTVTVVRVDIAPAPAFVVAGSTTFGVLVHASDDATRRATVEDLDAAFQEIARRRGLEIGIEHSVDPDATRCNPRIVHLFERAVEASGHPVVRLAQGAMTDAINMALLAPIGSALIRCRGGVGWGPGGIVDAADVEIGLKVLSHVISALASGGNTRSVTGE